MKILRKLRIFGSLDVGAKHQLVETLLVSVLVSLGFRLAGVARTQAWLRHWANSGSKMRQAQSVHADLESVRRAQRIVRRSARIEGTCLTRSLTLWAMLLRRGIPTELRVGFRRHGGRLEGHAWVEYEGIPVNEAEETANTYSAFDGSAAFDLRQKPDMWV